MTLDEANAEYHNALDELLLAMTPVTTADVWEDRLHKLDAAVRDVALASRWSCLKEGFSWTEAEIVRLFRKETDG